MLEKVTHFALKRKKITITFYLLLALGGFFAYFRLPKAEDPGYTVRSAKVTTFLSGASPERMELLVTDKLEKKIEELPQLEYVKSQSYTGLSSITVKIKEGYKTRPIWDALRRKVEEGARELPSAIVGPFVNDEFGDVFGTVLAITGEGYSFKEINDVAVLLQKELMSIPEVAKVEIYGEQKERIFIDVEDSRVSKMGSSSLALKNLLESQNIILGGGELLTEREKIVLEPTGNFRSVEEIKNATLLFPNTGEVVALKEIASIYRGYEEPEQTKVLASGKEALALAISLQEGGNITELGKKVRKAYQNFQRELPVGMTIEEVVFQSDSVKRKINAFVINLFQSILIVVAILLFFFGFKMGLVVASTIPLTILITFLFMDFWKVGIDQVSLASLILSLGLMVDNAIVISEAIAHKASLKKEGAALEAVKEFGFPLCISTLTTIAAFLPIVLANSAVGEYTSSIFKVVTIALLISWVLSLTWIPLLSLKWLKMKKINKWKEIELKYEAFLSLLLKHKFFSGAAFTALFVGAMSLVTFVPKTFFPPNEEGVFTMALEMPSGTHIKRTEEVVRGLERHLEKLNETVAPDSIVNWLAFVGGNAPRYILNYSPEPARAETAYVYINTNTYPVIDTLMKEIKDFSRKEYPELKLTLKKLFYGTPVEAPLGFRIKGVNGDTLEKITHETENYLKSFPSVENVRNNWGEKSKKIVLTVDSAKALRAGITHRDLAISLQTALSGFITSYYRENDTLIPIILRSVQSERENIDKLKLITVTSQEKLASVPLLQIADMDMQWERSKIVRRNRQKTVEIFADLSSNQVLKINKAMEKWLDEKKKSWPLGYDWEFSGEKEETHKARDSIYSKIPIAAIIVFLLLMVQCNSFRSVAIILSTIPLSLIGVVAGLLLIQCDFGFMGFLGVVALAGIIINNGIVLLQQISLSKQTLPPLPALLEASRLRLLPILLSTATAVGGLTPLIISGGGMFAQLSTVIVFGLLFGGLLTLGFVPLLYFYLFNLEKKT